MYHAPCPLIGCEGMGDNSGARFNHRSQEDFRVSLKHLLSGSWFPRRWPFRQGRFNLLVVILSAVVVVVASYFFNVSEILTGSRITSLDISYADLVGDRSCPTTRNEMMQPFHPNSIWNRPIGQGAQYVDADLEEGRVLSGITLDEDMIILAPSAPPKQLVTTGWASDKRCLTEGNDLYPGLQVPIPDNYETTFHGTTPNMSGAILLPDGDVLQNQPLHVCSVGGPAGSAFKYPTVRLDANEESKWGAHGGSALSSIGGTLRCGEMTRENPSIHHALKINVFANKYLLACSRGKPYDDSLIYRADAYACEDGPLAYGGTNPAVRMGSLLALAPDFEVDTLSTIPGQALAHALMEYGAYIVDDTARNVYAIPTSHEVVEQPDGSFQVCNFAEQFRQEWGFDFNQRRGDFANDFHQIVGALSSVVNNIKNSETLLGEPDPTPGDPKGWQISKTAGGGTELGCFASALE
ncbi:MAG: hypothetical protein AB4042_10030 [Leptolyngbyaceae cyanobacterium]